MWEHGVVVDVDEDMHTQDAYRTAHKASSMYMQDLHLAQAYTDGICAAVMECDYCWTTSTTRLVCSS